MDTPLGTMIALTDSSCLHLLEFSNRARIDLQLARYRNRLNAAFAPGETAVSRTLRHDSTSGFSISRKTMFLNSQRRPAAKPLAILSVN